LPPGRQLIVQNFPGLSILFERKCYIQGRPTGTDLECCNWLICR
jgi:hypothetical protein